MGRARWMFWGLASTIFGCMTFSASEADAQISQSGAAGSTAANATATPAANAAAPSQTEPTPPSDSTAAKRASADPFLVTLRSGDSAYLARDFDGAARAYEEAIKQQPQNALGHLRLGETLRAKGELDAALQAFGSALRFAASLGHKVRAAFLIADTQERARNLSQAKLDWAAALQVSDEHAAKLAQKAAGVSASDGVYAESIRERSNQVAAALVRNEQYAAVRQRIEKREAELNAKTRGGDKPSN